MGTIRGERRSWALYFQNRRRSRLAIGSISYLTSGSFYRFTATQFLLFNPGTSRYYLPQIVGPAGVEAFDVETEVVGPVAAGAIPNSGVNFEFTTTGWLRLKHATFGTFHDWYIVGPADAYGFFADVGVASAAGTFAGEGQNYRFTGGDSFQLKDFGLGLFHSIFINGPHGAQGMDIL